MYKVGNYILKERNIYGIPCTGGKSELADILCDLIEGYAEQNGIRKFFDVCGGGGKIVFSLNHKLFNFLGYNEYEYGLATLMASLKDHNNLLKISHEVQHLIEGRIDGLLPIPSSDDKSQAAKDRKKAIEAKLKELFNEAKACVSCDPSKITGDMDNIKVSAYATILIWGSYRNNRLSFSYGKFIQNLYKNQSYFKVFRELSELASDVHFRNVDCIKIIEEFSGCKDMFLYIDPPYWGSDSYTNNFKFEDHIDLCDACKAADCKIMISMHEEGLAPYLFSLFWEKGWHLYLLPEIDHHSKSAYMTDKDEPVDAYEPRQADPKSEDETKSENESESEDELKYEDESYRNILKNLAAIIHDIDKQRKNKVSLVEHKTVNEYIFCNFEISGFEEVIREVTIDEKGEFLIYSNDTDKIYFDDSDDPDKYDWYKLISIASITKEIVYNLYRQYKVGNEVEEAAKKAADSFTKLCGTWLSADHVKAIVEIVEDDIEKQKDIYDSLVIDEKNEAVSQDDRKEGKRKKAEYAVARDIYNLYLQCNGENKAESVARNVYIRSGVELSIDQVIAIVSMFTEGDGKWAERYYGISTDSDSDSEEVSDS